MAVDDIKAWAHEMLAVIDEDWNAAEDLRNGINALPATVEALDEDGKMYLTDSQYTDAGRLAMLRADCKSAIATVRETLGLTKETSDGK